MKLTLWRPVAAWCARSSTGKLLAAGAGIDRWLTERRLRAYSAIALAVWLVALAGSILPAAFAAATGLPVRNVIGDTPFPDFLNRWTGGWLLLHGEGALLYDPDLQIALQRSIVGPQPGFGWFINPPYVAALYAPLAALPFLAAAFVWSALSIGALALAAYLLRPLVPSLAHGHWRTVLLVIAAAPPTFEAIGSGQDTAISLLIWVAGIRLALARRDAAAGTVFALGLYKPQLFLLPLLVFLCWGRWRAVAGWSLSALALGLLGLAAGGMASVRAWVAALSSPLYREGIQVAQAWKMQNLSALVTAAAPPELRDGATVVGLAAAAALAVTYLRAVRSHGRIDDRSELRCWALAALTTVLASPHVHFYDLLLAALPILVMLDVTDGRLRRRATRLAAAALFLLTWTLAPRHLLVGGADWPLTALGASWTALPLLVLWGALLWVERSDGLLPTARQSR